MNIRNIVRPALAAACMLLVFSTPAFAQEDDSAVEATQEELDAVGGLRGKEKAPTLESVDTAPESTTSENTTAAPVPNKEENDGDAPSAGSDGLTVSLRVGLGFSAMKTPGFNTDFSVRDDSPSRSIYARFI